MEDGDRYARLRERSDIALMKDVSCGNKDAFNELIDRYMDIVSRNSFRILCDRGDCEYVIRRVFVSLPFQLDGMASEEGLSVQPYTDCQKCGLASVRGP